MTKTPKHATRKQAQQAATALEGLLATFCSEWPEATIQRVTAALELTRKAAQRSQLMGYALLYLSPRAAADLLAQRKTTP